METKRPEPVGPRNKESNPRASRNAQQQVNQAMILITNLSVRSGPRDRNNLQGHKNQGIQLPYEKRTSMTATGPKI